MSITLSPGKHKKGVSNTGSPFFRTRIDEHRRFPMFDYQEISMYTAKVTPNFAYLSPTYQKPGWDWYRLDLGVNPLKIGYSDPTRELIIKGSLPYFNQSHNATHGQQQHLECWEYIGDMLGLGRKIFTGTVNAFEFGVIVDTPFPAAIILPHHTHLPGFKASTFTSKSGKIESKIFTSAAMKVKLYDPLANYRSKRIPKAAYAQQLGLIPGSNHLRIENHYLKPEICFKQRVLLTDFFNPNYQQHCKTDLMETYRRINKTSAIGLPDDKAKLSSGNIILAAFQSFALQSGANVEQLINSTLSQIPSEVLTREDRKARKRQIKKMFEEISSKKQSSPYDLSEQLRQKLSECP